ncbi:M48 family metalloprotease [Candidatus Micrarchaeota archaeon]|nr:M48 family metalloprotease [Candidatus Micrarchaeota archaeon]
MGLSFPSTGNLNLRIMLTSILIFGTIAAIMGMVLYSSGISGTNAVFMWLLFSILMLGIQWYLGPSIIKWATGAKELSIEHAPEIHQMIEHFARIANIPKPKLYVVNNPTPNAFAFGRTQSDAGIAIHVGLLKILNKEEVEGVLAHEMGHIKHRDVVVMTVASVIPVILYYAVILFGGRDDRRGGNFFLVWIGAFIAQFLGQLLVMWVSRSREYYADVFAAHATRKPLHLMTALAKISYVSAHSKGNAEGMVKAFYFSNASASEASFASEIVNLISAGNEKDIASAIANEKKKGGFELIMTHPLTYKRLDALLKIKKEIGA